MEISLLDMSVGTSAELCSRGARKAPAPIPDSTHGMRNSFLSMDRTGAEVTPPAAVQRGDSVAVVSAVPASSTPSVYVSSYGGLAPRGPVSATPALPVLPVSSGPLHASLAGGMQLRLPSMDAVPRPAGQSVPSAVSFPAGNFAVAAPRAPSSRAVLASKLHRKDFLPGPTVSASSPFGVGRDEVTLAHRKKRRAPREFDCPIEKQAFLVQDQLDALVPLLPALVSLEMLGGARGLEQVPDEGRRATILASILGARAGSEGARCADIRLFLGMARAYAQEVMGAPPGGEDEALWPMSTALAHELVATEHARATGDGKGSQGGKTVGHHRRETIIFLADREKMRWPIDTSRLALEAAAPKATAVARRKAGTLPIGVHCQLEFFAAGGLSVVPLDILPLEAREAVEFESQSLLAAGLDQSVRMGEGVRVRMWPDTEDPDGVMRGCAHLGKDGSPIDIFAPAEGYLGTYTWYRKWLRRVLELGQVFPKWKRVRGRGASILASVGLTGWLSSADEVRGALADIMSLPPLAYTAAEIAAWDLRGHSAHATPPEYARTLGVRPRLGVQLAPSLSDGFNEADCCALGHWLRDQGAKDQATASQAAMAARGPEARQAAAQALTGGQPGTRAGMTVYYGAGGATSSRFSEREIQLDVRQRLVHTIRALVTAAGGWRALPRGQADLAILRSLRQGI